MKSKKKICFVFVILKENIKKINIYSNECFYFEKFSKCGIIFQKDDVDQRQ